MNSGEHDIVCFNKDLAMFWAKIGILVHVRPRGGVVWVSCQWTVLILPYLPTAISSATTTSSADVLEIQVVWFSVGIRSRSKCGWGYRMMVGHVNRTDKA